MNTEQPPVVEVKDEPKEALEITPKEPEQPEVSPEQVEQERNNAINNLVNSVDAPGQPHITTTLNEGMEKNVNKYDTGVEIKNQASGEIAKIEEEKKAMVTAYSQKIQAVGWSSSATEIPSFANVSNKETPVEVQPSVEKSVAQENVVTEPEKPVVEAKVEEPVAEADKEQSQSLENAKIDDAEKGNESMRQELEAQLQEAKQEEESLRQQVAEVSQKQKEVREYDQNVSHAKNMLSEIESNKAKFESVLDREITIDTDNMDDMEDAITFADQAEGGNEKIDKGILALLFELLSKYGLIKSNAETPKNSTTESKSGTVDSEAEVVKTETKESSSTSEQKKSAERIKEVKAEVEKKDATVKKQGAVLENATSKKPAMETTLRKVFDNFKSTLEKKANEPPPTKAQVDAIEAQASTLFESYEKSKKKVADLEAKIESMKKNESETQPKPTEEKIEENKPSPESTVVAENVEKETTKAEQEISSVTEEIKEDAKEGKEVVADKKEAEVVTGNNGVPIYYETTASDGEKNVQYMATSVPESPAPAVSTSTEIPSFANSEPAQQETKAEEIKKPEQV